MKKYLITIYCLLITNYSLMGQINKQVSEVGKEVCADAPWQMNMHDSSGALSSIPIHISIHDADGFGNNAELVGIDISLKNSSSTSFSSPLFFNNYSDSAFLKLFSSKSLNNTALEIQSFDPSLPQKSPDNTIRFTAQPCPWPSSCSCVNITERLWYFTFNIPPDKLAGFEDIIDIKVEFRLNGESDKSIKLRVFRNNSLFPALEHWYRGDVHYHTAFTDNLVEMGLDISATKEAAKKIGLDWITVTDHSCDFDNYGFSINDNWNRLGNEILNLNSSDSTLTLIRGIEASLNNSSGNIVHCLIYPNELQPYSFPYIGDGNGDMTATSVSLNQALNETEMWEGFAYAAHPFGSEDKLPSIMNGGIWNIGDTLFLANTSALPGYGMVICNDPSVPSDIFPDPANNALFIKSLVGSEIWNDRNNLTCTGDISDAWVVENPASSNALQLYDSTNAKWHFNRFLQGLEVQKYLWKKGLKEKYLNPALNHYKFFISAGSDAHGSFNYSNTEFTYGVTGEINDNALGKLTTLAYCPYGKGIHGEHILSALRNGNTLISDGPIAVISIDTNNSFTNDYIHGNEAFLSANAFNQSVVRVKFISNHAYGNLFSAHLIIGSRQGEITLQLNINNTAVQQQMCFSLDSLLSSISPSYIFQPNEVLYLRTEISTLKNYANLSPYFKATEQKFHAFTNPIWIILPSSLSSNNDNSDYHQFTTDIFPNPSNNYFNLRVVPFNNEPFSIKIFNLAGQQVLDIAEKNLMAQKYEYKILENMPAGFYTIITSCNKYTEFLKAIKIK